MSEPQLDWSQAEVKQGILTVSIAGDPPRGWKDTFQRTAQLLSNGEWQDISLKKHSVRVEGLRPGAEEKLRHFLESVVQQANATHEEPSDEDTSDDDGATGQDEDADDPAKDESPSEDTEMTERFRSFA
jgi:hypothetical protein